MGGVACGGSFASWQSRPGGCLSSVGSRTGIATGLRALVLQHDGVTASEWTSTIRSEMSQDSMGLLNLY